MPTLHWVGKDKVVRHHHDVPFKVLKREYRFASVNPSANTSTGNKIIHGDNLEALKALLPEYEGRIKCIYIDPPYNTGNEGWVYNDNVNDPRIVKWLHQVVGKEGEDLSRHDKWLCMMYPRLKLLHRLLAEDGVIFVSIDDDEVHYLRAIIEEIFGRNGKIATLVWRTDGNFDNQAKVKICHEYIFMYSKYPDNFPHPPIIDPSIPEKSKLFRPTIRNTIVKNGPKNPVSKVILPSGFPADFEQGTIPARESLWPKFDDDLIIKSWALVNSVTVQSGWSSKELFEDFISSGFKTLHDSKGQPSKFVLTQTGAIEIIKQRTKPSHVISTLTGFGSTQSTSASLSGAGVSFPYPKPVDLIAYLASMVDDRDFTILDSFAGSGTTAHAVLKLNAQDGGNRKFILVEMMDYAETITAERVRRVMDGYGEAPPSGKEDKRVKGLGGGFDYYTLGEALFNEDGQLNEAVGVEAILRYVAYTERVTVGAGHARNDRATDEDDSRAWLSPTVDGCYYLGETHGVQVHFIYQPDGVTSLDLDLLAKLAIKPGKLVIYADQCLLGEEFMRRHGIIFKKIPRDITRF